VLAAGAGSKVMGFECRFYAKGVDVVEAGIVEEAER
jgi:hypothetical protein